MEIVSQDGSTYQDIVAGDLYKMNLESNVVVKLAEGHVSQIYILEDDVYYFEQDYTKPQELDGYYLEYSEELKGLSYISDLE